MSCVPVVATERSGKLGRIDRRLPVAIPVPLPSQHLQAGKIQARHRLAHERRDRSEVFGDHLGLRVGAREDPDQRFAKRDLRRLVGGSKNASCDLSIGRTYMRYRPTR